MKVRWNSEITIGSGKYSLGVFQSEQEAINAYRQAMECLRKSSSHPHSGLEGWQYDIPRSVFLPTERAAQQLPLKRIPNFLSSADIKAVRDLAASLPMMGGAANWGTKYLHWQSHFQQKLPNLYNRILRFVRRVDTKESWNLLRYSHEHDRLQVRCTEYHQVSPGGALTQYQHKDTGSLVTIDCLLTDTSEFTGGQFCVMQATGASASVSSPSAVGSDGDLDLWEWTNMEPQRFDKGDAIVFPSHKFHNITPLLSGRRAVLVMELWEGEERTCPHR